jgi:hypothetical protein
VKIGRKGCRDGDVFPRPWRSVRAESVSWRGEMKKGEFEKEKKVLFI